jgi:FdhD protein
MKFALFLKEVKIFIRNCILKKVRYYLLVCTNVLRGEMETRLLVEIKKCGNDSADYISDIVVLERSITIFVNGLRLVSLAYLPKFPEELVLGFLLSEGIIDQLEQIQSMEFDGSNMFLEIDIKQERLANFMHSGEKTSGCGSALSNSILSSSFLKTKTFSIETIFVFMSHFMKNAMLFKETGGVHSSALANKKIEFVADDIGRHNAVDKVIGMALKENKNLEDYILLTSGRISSEIVKKAIRAKIPFLVSHSAPTSEAIRLGWKYGVVIVGFTRGSHCNVYTYFDSVF